MFYERYAELCKINHIAPSRVADECGFNRGTVSIWKKQMKLGNDIRPTKEIAEKIANYFNVSESWLLGLDVEEHPSVIVDGMTPAKQKLLDTIDGLSEEQLLKIISLVDTAKKMI